MRATFIGSNSLTLSTAELLLEDGHQVIIIEQDRNRIDQLSERLDAGFVHGDGTPMTRLITSPLFGGCRVRLGARAEALEGLQH